MAIGIAIVITLLGFLYIAFVPIGKIPVAMLIMLSWAWVFLNGLLSTLLRHWFIIVGGLVALYYIAKRKGWLKSVKKK